MNMSLDGIDPEYLKRYGQLPLCTVCERPMRPAGEKARDWPSTVQYATESSCKTCFATTFSPIDARTSAARALRMTDGVREVTHRGLRGAVTQRLERVIPRAAAARAWSEEQRAFALQVCGRVGNATEAGEILEMFGLFDGGNRPVASSPHHFNGPRL